MTAAASISNQSGKYRNSSPMVLSVLEMFVSEKGARLSIKELADQTGRSISTVRRALKSLSEAGQVTIRRNAGDCRNGGTTNCYELDTPPVILDDNLTPPLPFDEIPPVIFSAEDVTPPVIFADSHEPEVEPNIHTRGDAPTHGAAGEKDLSLSLRAKDKGKRKREKKKDISPFGESPLSLTPKQATGDRILTSAGAYQTAVVDAFKVKAGGFAGIIAQQLLGTATRGKRSDYNVTPLMTPVEIVAFGQWYGETFGSDVKVPTSAETLHERVTQFRDDTTKHAKKMAIAKPRLERLLNPAKPAAPPREHEKPLSSGDMVPVREDEVDGLVKLGFMVADEMPRPTMTIIYDRMTVKMGKN